MGVKRGKTLEQRQAAGTALERKKANAATIKGERGKGLSLESLEKRVRALEELAYDNTGLLD